MVPTVQGDLPGSFMMQAFFSVNDPQLHAGGENPNSSEKPWNK